MDSYRDLVATQLWCPRCKATVNVRQRLLLILPDSNLYEYFCVNCSESLGKRTEPAAGNLNIGAVALPEERGKGRRG